MLLKLAAMLASLTSAAFSFVMGCIYPVAERKMSRTVNQQSVGGLLLYLLTFLLTFGLTFLASFVAANALQLHSAGGKRLVLAAYVGGVAVMTLVKRWGSARER